MQFAPLLAATNKFLSDWDDLHHLITFAWRWKTFLGRPLICGNKLAADHDKMRDNWLVNLPSLIRNKLPVAESAKCLPREPFLAAKVKNYHDFMRSMKSPSISCEIRRDQLRGVICEFIESLLKSNNDKKGPTIESWLDEKLALAQIAFLFESLLIMQIRFVFMSLSRPSPTTSRGGWWGNEIVRSKFQW